MKKPKVTPTPKQIKLPLLNGEFLITMTRVGSDRFTIDSVKQLPKKKKGKVPSLPTEGAIKFFVACHRLGIYTSIGADNVHHAFNKATKLFGPHWSFIRDEFHSEHIQGYEFQTVAKFNELIKMAGK